jgi:hypothetical protein
MPKKPTRGVNDLFREIEQSSLAKRIKFDTDHLKEFDEMESLLTDHHADSIESPSNIFVFERKQSYEELTKK